MKDNGKDEVGLRRISYGMGERRLQWFGHVICMEDNRGVCGGRDGKGGQR